MNLKKILLKQHEYLPFWLSLMIVFIVSANTYHTDLSFLTKLAERVANGNFNLYQNVIVNNNDLGRFIMPPLIGLLDGFLYFIFKELKIINFQFNYLNQHIPLLRLLALKSRLILVFILSYPLAYKTAFIFTQQNKELSRRIANLWIASPILIYLPFASSNNDLYPVILSLVFLLYAFRGNYLTAMIFLGLTAALKNYAVFLFLPVALILAEKDTKKTLLYCMSAIVPFILPSLFYIKDLTKFTGSNYENLLMLKTVIPSFEANYSIFAIGYFLIIFFLLFNDNIKKLKEDKNNLLVIYCFVVLSLFFVTFFIPSWFLWILPFFVFLIYNKDKLYTIYLFISSAFFIMLITNWPNNLDLNLWRERLPALAPGANIFPSIASPTLMTLASSLFVALIITFIYFLKTDRENKIKQVTKRNSVFLSYLPTCFNILLLIAFSIVTIHQNNNRIKENSVVLKALASQNHTLFNLSENELLKQSVLENISRNGNTLYPSSIDPQVFFSTGTTNISDKNIYIIIKFNDNVDRRPQFFWDKKGDNAFSEENSVWLTKADSQTYYAKLGPNFIPSKPKTFRMDPEVGQTPLEINFIKIIRTD